MSKDNEMRLSAPASVWLWISVAAAVVGAFMLFPIGTTPLNVIFVAVKACMVIGLAVVLLPVGSQALCSGQLQVPPLS